MSKTPKRRQAVVEDRTDAAPEAAPVLAFKETVIGKLTITTFTGVRQDVEFATASAAPAAEQ